MSDSNNKKPQEKLLNKPKKQKIVEEKPKPEVITREEKDALLKLPFILLVERLKYTKPLQAALKTVYNWTDSTLLTKNELTEFARKWLHGKQSNF